MLHFACYINDQRLQKIFLFFSKFYTKTVLVSKHSKDSWLFDPIAEVTVSSCT